MEYPKQNVQFFCTFSNCYSKTDFQGHSIKCSSNIFNNNKQLINVIFWPRQQHPKTTGYSNDEIIHEKLKLRT